MTKRLTKEEKARNKYQRDQQRKREKEREEREAAAEAEYAALPGLWMVTLTVPKSMMRVMMHEQYINHLCGQDGESSTTNRFMIELLKAWKLRRSDLVLGMEL